MDFGTDCSEDIIEEFLRNWSSFPNGSDEENNTSHTKEKIVGNTSESCITSFVDKELTATESLNNPFSTSHKHGSHDNFSFENDVYSKSNNESLPFREMKEHASVCHSSKVTEKKSTEPCKTHRIIFSLKNPEKVEVKEVPEKIGIHPIYNEKLDTDEFSHVIVVLDWSENTNDPVYNLAKMSLFGPYDENHDKNEEAFFLHADGTLEKFENNRKHNSLPSAFNKVKSRTRKNFSDYLPTCDLPSGGIISKVKRNDCDTASVLHEVNEESRKQEKHFDSNILLKSSADDSTAKQNDNISELGSDTVCIPGTETVKSNPLEEISKITKPILRDSNKMHNNTISKPYTKKESEYDNISDKSRVNSLESNVKMDDEDIASVPLEVNGISRKNKSILLKLFATKQSEKVSKLCSDTVNVSCTEAIRSKRLDELIKISKQFYVNNVSNKNKSTSKLCDSNKKTHCVASKLSCNKITKTGSKSKKHDDELRLKEIHSVQLESSSIIVKKHGKEKTKQCKSNSLKVQKHEENEIRKSYCNLANVENHSKNKVKKCKSNSEKSERYTKKKIKQSKPHSTNAEKYSKKKIKHPESVSTDVVKNSKTKLNKAGYSANVKNDDENKPNESKSNLLKAGKNFRESKSNSENVEKHNNKKIGVKKCKSNSEKSERYNKKKIKQSKHHSTNAEKYSKKKIKHPESVSTDVVKHSKTKLNQAGYSANVKNDDENKPNQSKSNLLKAGKNFRESKSNSENVEKHNNNNKKIGQSNSDSAKIGRRKRKIVSNSEVHEAINYKRRRIVRSQGQRCSNYFLHTSKIDVHNSSKYSQQSNLKQSQLSHCEDFSVPCFECEKCSENFFTKQHLNNHTALHEAKEYFECDSCKKKFTHKRSLTYHVLTHIGEYRFKCKDCGRGFSHTTSYKIHCHAHGKEKRFTCDVCGEGFMYYIRIVSHMGLHFDNPNYYNRLKCYLCNKVYATSSGLYKHVSHIHRKNTLCCPYCFHRYGAQNLREHLKRCSAKFLKESGYNI